jgi:hypothetical protein
MSDKKDFWGPPDPLLYVANKSRFPWEELRKYAGQWVAWSLDGARILGADADIVALGAKLKAAGLDPQQAVYDLRPPDDGTDSEI